MSPLRRIGQFLAIVTQLVVLCAPLAEAHVDREMRAHVESPRSAPHPGQHDQKLCPACVMLSLHANVEPVTALAPLARCVGCTLPVAVLSVSSHSGFISNLSRAPPLAM